MDRISRTVLKISYPPTSFSPDGTRLAYQEAGNLSILPLDLSDSDRPKPGTPQSLVSTPAFVTFSPDGH